MVAGPPPNLAILAWTDPVAIIMLVGAGMVSTVGGVFLGIFGIDAF